jgi:hypothetical protein
MWDPRSAQTAPIVDGLVSQVRIVSRRHALFGEILPVIAVRSARGPKFVVVRLPDGRRRSIPRSITDLAREPFPRGRDSIEESCRVSVRTLLPLASFLAARLPLLEGIGDDCAASFGPDALDESGPDTIGIGSHSAATLADSAGRQQEPDCVDPRRYGEADGDERSGGAR